MLAAGLLLSGCAKQPVATESPAPQPKEPIKIGWLGPLTGDVATIGLVANDAARLAVKEINEQGGINGAPIELISEDGKCEAKTANAGGTKLIEVDKVKVIVGGCCSSETLSVSPLANERKVVMLSPCSSAPSVTTAGDYIFRVIPSDAYQGKFAAQLAYNTLGKRKVAFLTAITDYTQGLRDAFKDEFVKLGGTVMASEEFKQTDRDLKTQLTKIKNSKPDLIYFVTYTEAGIVGFKQAKELGITTQFLGVDTYTDPKFYVADGLESVIYTVPKSDATEAFKQKFFAATNRDSIPAYVTQNYDVVNLLAQVMKSAGTDADSIKNALYGIKDYAGVSGQIGFDQNGDLLSANYDIMIIKDKKPVPYEMPKVEVKLDLPDNVGAPIE